jgi:uncharacterized protein DUF4339
MTYDGHDSSGPAPPLPADAEAEPLAPFSEEDDVATQEVQLPRNDFKWIVQLTPLDRRMMDTAQLVAELLEGTRVQRSTLVWRGGMDDWQPIEKISELPVSARSVTGRSVSGRSVSGRSATTLPAAARRRVLMAPQRAVLISLVVALSATAMAIFALSKRGAFDAKSSATAGAETVPPPTGSQTASASQTAVRALEPSERAEVVPVAAPVEASGATSDPRLE